MGSGDCEIAVSGVTQALTTADLDTLKTNPLLADLPPTQFSTFVDYLALHLTPRGEFVVREGDDGCAMYFLLVGRAQVRRGTLELHPVEPPRHFGELAFMGLRRRAASIEAQTDLRLCRLDRGGFERMGRDHADIALEFLRRLVTSVGETLVEVTDSVSQLLRERSLPRRIEVAVKGPTGTSWVRTGTLVGSLLPERVEGALVVAGLMDNRPVTLEAPITSDAMVAPLSISSWEGRQIYRRAVALLFLEAARQVTATSNGSTQGSVRFFVGPSVGHASVIRVEGFASADLSQLSQAIERRMIELAASHEDLREELWTVDEARTHFESHGWHEALALLRTWRDSTVPLVCCGQTYAIFQGPVLVDCGGITDLSLWPHPDGMLLHHGTSLMEQIPGAGNDREQAVARERTCPRFGGTMVRDHRTWLDAMGITSVGAFNEYCVTGQVSQVARVAEGFHEKRLGQIADRIQEARGHLRIVKIAGPSSSGKTTFIRRLSVQLAIHGMRALILSLDDYYVDRESTVRDAQGELDFEAFEAINGTLLRDQVSRLLNGESIKLARYDFKAGKSHSNGGELVGLDPGGVIILEGIHGLNPTLLGGVVPDEQQFSIFIQPSLSLPLDRLSCVSPADVRLIRRIVRDRHQRGYRASDNIERWASVRRGEHMHIYPNMAAADMVFDSSLVYEVSVLKVFAERYLLEIPQDHPTFPTAFRLRHLLDRFVTIYPDHVPPTSILREFIGGSGFDA